jgi:drug/metabolite transporter superfamily protein YnfA
MRLYVAAVILFVLRVALCGRTPLHALGLAFFAIVGVFVVTLIVWEVVRHLPEIMHALTGHTHP